VQVNRVVVGVSGSAGSLVALRYAHDLAQDHDGGLMPVLAWARLSEAIDLGIGGPPAALRFEPHVVRGEAGAVLTRIARQRGDVLIIGTGRHGAMRRLASCHVARYCLGHGACPVIAVPPTDLADAAHGLRGWMDRHRAHPEDALRHVTRRWRLAGHDASRGPAASRLSRSARQACGTRPATSRAATPGTASSRGRRRPRGRA
jgi:nucleotide-binding universal stress UspA family protein